MLFGTCFALFVAIHTFNNAPVQAQFHRHDAINDAPIGEMLLIDAPAWIGRTVVHAMEQWSDMSYNDGEHARRAEPNFEDLVPTPYGVLLRLCTSPYAICAAVGLLGWVLLFVTCCSRCRRRTLVATKHD